jgi:hypothetical protein
MIIITIDTDNQSFEDNGLINELEKIFNKIIGKIERSDTFVQRQVKNPLTTIIFTFLLTYYFSS